MRNLFRAGQLLLIIALVLPLQAQKKGVSSIQSGDLKPHMKFLASDELEGRETGSRGLEIAARYLASQAEGLGLESVNGEEGYFQHYVIHEKAYDRENSKAVITTAGHDSLISRDPFYFFSSNREDRTVLEGEVVFAGYGIHDVEQDYNDFKDLDIEGKIVLIMSRAPMDEKGAELRFGGQKYSGMMSFRSKLPYIYSQNPKAVLMAYDPKSGMRSLEEVSAGMTDYLSRSRSLDGEGRESSPERARPLMVTIHRNLADLILRESGKNLEEWQREIDRDLTPHSFPLEGTALRIELQMKHTELVVPNIFGLIEGSDPDLKDEVVLYMAHFDHLGTDGKGGVYNGADDNASGTAGLIEIAQAFKNEKKPPRRSVGFLWVSAEEIGLFGSQYFADHPLIPIDNIAAVINLDMIGRTKNLEDMQSGRSGLTISGGDTVKVIGGLQSSLVMEINKEVLEEMGMVGNYQYNDRNHPDRYFYRSDHINFARKDIPVLFYSTGTHRDYHTVEDTEDRLDYNNFEKMVRMGYLVGDRLAGYNGPIEVDNPMSDWEDQSGSR
nr:predicted aminopeptidase [uncultured bacterium]